jgi:DNA-binding MarR family transcriptional regulator
MTVLVSGLERAGLVERGAGPTDKRAALVALTAAGSDYLQARRRANAEAFDQLIDKLPTDEVAALAAAIPALVHLRELDDEERNLATRRTDGRSKRAGQ